MSNNTLKEIKNAEQRAAQIRADAAARAREAVAASERRNAARLAAAETDSENDRAATLDAIEEKSAGLVAKSAADAHAEADAIRRGADGAMDEAVKKIYWEICEKCQ